MRYIQNPAIFVQFGRGFDDKELICRVLSSFLEGRQIETAIHTIPEITILPGKEWPQRAVVFGQDYGETCHAED